MSTSFGWEVKGRYGSFRYRMCAGCAGKTMRSLENACHTWAPQRCAHDKALYKSTFTFTSCLVLLHYCLFSFLIFSRLATRLHHRGSTGPAEHLVRTTPNMAATNLAIITMSLCLEGGLSVATWYDTAWIGGTASVWIFIQICLHQICATSHGSAST